MSMAATKYNGSTLWILLLLSMALQNTKHKTCLVLFCLFVVACIPNESIKLIMALHYALLSPWQLYSGIVLYSVLP